MRHGRQPATPRMVVPRSQMFLIMPMLGGLFLDQKKNKAPGPTKGSRSLIFLQGARVKPKAVKLNFFSFKGLESIISSGSICSRHLFLLLVLITKPVLLASFSATSRGLYGNERFLFDFLLMFAFQRTTSIYRTLYLSPAGQHFSPCPVLLVNISTPVQYAFVKIVFTVLWFL